MWSEYKSKETRVTSTFSPVPGDVKEGEELGAELTGDVAAGEVADLRRDLTEGPRDEAGRAPWFIRVRLLPDGPGSRPRAWRSTRRDIWRPSGRPHRSYPRASGRAHQIP